MVGQDERPRPWPGSKTLRRAGRALAADGASAGLWLIITVPPSFGFWLVAGNLAGVPAAGTRTLVAASLLAIGVATLIQVIAGYRLPIFEGPASTYLAAIAVIHTGHVNQARGVAGGLLAAAIFVLALGLLGADRVMKRLFTPAVVSAFLVIVVITVAPDTLKAMIGHTSAHPWGVAAGWVSALLVIGVAVVGQRVGWLRPYSLLLALAIGSLAYFVIAGFSGLSIDSHWTAPSPFPWGSPTLSVSIAAPFLVAGLLASFNTIASINVMASALDSPADPNRERRGVIAHGTAQCVTACMGNVLGHVPRLDSVGVVRLIRNPRPRALAIAAAATIALAFVSPLVQVLAQIPVPVSASLLAFVLSILLLQGLRQVATLDWPFRWFVFVPAIVPAAVWIPLQNSLSHTLQLVCNPLLVGVALGIVLDRVVRLARPLPTAANSA